MLSGVLDRYKRAVVKWNEIAHRKRGALIREWVRSRTSRDRKCQAKWEETIEAHARKTSGKMRRLWMHANEVAMPLCGQRRQRQIPTLESTPKVP